MIFDRSFCKLTVDDRFLFIRFSFVHEKTTTVRRYVGTYGTGLLPTGMESGEWRVVESEKWSSHWRVGTKHLSTTVSQSFRPCTVPGLNSSTAGGGKFTSSSHLPSPVSLVTSLGECNSTVQSRTYYMLCMSVVYLTIPTYIYT